MPDTDSDSMECAQCGICCKVFGDSISPTIENVYHWIEHDRADILEHFSACKNDGSWTKCSELEMGELSDVISIELRDPETGGYESRCPFLKRASRERYICSIHLSKPDMCNNYKPWIWGETYFRRCRTLTRLDQTTFWNRS
ncbi:MAG TPA: YkgJ family cysteine cluster protein [Methanoregulaceae archaeon]|nr:YkgJ family cysteine cluster protein [Methanoregulaceae archaeon]